MSSAALAFAAVGLAHAGAFVGLRWLAGRVGRMPPVTVALAGPFGCYLVAALLVATGLALAGSSEMDARSMRVSLMAEGPAAKAGMVRGDRILAVDDIPVSDWPALLDAISARAGHDVGLAIEREGQRRVITATAGKNGRIGVAPFVEQRELGWPAALGKGLTTPPLLLMSTVTGWARMLTGRPPSIEAFGAVAVARDVKDGGASATGWAMWFLGSMSSWLVWGLVVFSLLQLRRARASAPE